MPQATSQPTSMIQKVDRCGDLDHRPRVLLGKMGLDGHDRGVKIIARALRDSGVHVIYSGLWQTPRCLAIGGRDEDVDVIACSMMSNSHLVLIPRLIDACREVGRGDIPINIGGVIPKEDIPMMLEAGVKEIFHTGTSLHDIVESVRSTVGPQEVLVDGDATAQLARALTITQQQGTPPPGSERRRPRKVIGLTGSPGAGKSTLVAALAAERARRGERMAVLAFDPMSTLTGGALLGDRLRVDFNAVDDAVFYRSMAIVGEDYATLPAMIELVGGAGYDMVIIETVGAGQNDVAIREHVDETVVVVVPGMGDAVQMDKAGILEIADTFVVNKADHAGENTLVKQLLDIAQGRPVLETIATRGQGTVELLDALTSSG